MELENDNKFDSIIEDGKLGDEDSNEFWAHFGGYAPIAKKSNLESDVEAKPTPAKLIWYVFLLLIHSSCSKLPVFLSFLFFQGWS